MAKDEAIRHQKVFISLDAVLELQRKYTEYRQSADTKPVTDPAYNVTAYTRNGLEMAIDILGLPIPTRKGGS